MKRLAWIAGGLFLVAVLAPGAAAGSWVASIVTLLVVPAALYWLIRGSRSGHGEAKSLRGLTRYRWSDLPEDALLGLAIGDLALAWGLGTVGAVLAAVVVAGCYRVFRRVETAKWAIRGVVGTVATLTVVRLLLVEDGCGDTIADRRGLVLVVLASVGIMAASAAWSFLRIGRTGPRLELVELPLLAYGLIELAVAFFTPGGQDLVSEHPLVAIAAVPAMLLLGGLAGANPKLVLGLLGVGLGLAKVLLAAVEGQLNSGTSGVDPGTLCYGGWATVIATFTFLFVSGISVDRRPVDD